MINKSMYDDSIPSNPLTQRHVKEPVYTGWKKVFRLWKFVLSIEWDREPLYGERFSTTLKNLGTKPTGQHPFGHKKEGWGENSRKEQNKPT